MPSNQGTLHLTDSTATTVEKTHYDAKTDVYAYGNLLADGSYDVEVVAPGGKSGTGADDILGLSDPNHPVQVVNGHFYDGIVSLNPALNLPQTADGPRGHAFNVWDVVYLTNDGINPIVDAPHQGYADTTNNGGEYQVVIAQHISGETQDNFAQITGNNAVTKSKNFKVGLEVTTQPTSISTSYTLYAPDGSVSGTGNDSTTTGSVHAPAGSTAVDTATVVVTDGSGVAVNAGTVDFQFFNADTGAIIDDSSVNVDANGKATDPFTAGPLGAGNYYFIAAFSDGTSFSDSQSGQEPFTILAPSLSVVKTPDAATANSTDTVGFTIVVSNASGAGTAYGVSLNDPLPDSATLTWVIASDTSGKASISGGTLSDSIGNLVAGASVTIHVTAGTPAGYANTLTNTATATPTNGSAASGKGTETVLAPDVDVTKTADKSTATVGDTVGFTVTLNNEGQGTGYGVTLSDTLPSLGGGYTWSIDTNDANNDFVITTNAITGVQTLATKAAITVTAGQSVSVHVKGTAGVAGTLTNTATVTGTNESAAETTDTSTASTTVYLKITGFKFDDKNTNKVFDTGETKLGGWTIQLYKETNGTSGLQTTGTTPDTLVATAVTLSDGTYSFTNLSSGTYYVREVLQTNWVQTVGDKDYTSINTNQTDNFGNVLISNTGGTNARTLGYWGGPNGQTVLTGSKTGKNVYGYSGNNPPLGTPAYWSLLFGKGGVLDKDGTNSVLVDGSGKVLTDAYFGTYSNLASYLNNASSTNMAYMMGAQLLALELNIQAGYIDPTQYVYIPNVSSLTTANKTALQSGGAYGGAAFPGNFARISDLVSAAITELKGGGTNTLSGAKGRDYQEALKSIFDSINSDGNIFVS